MLSQNIRSLREKFADYQEIGLNLPGNEVRRLVRVLRKYETLVRQLEQSAINPTDQITEQHMLDGTVVFLPIVARDNKSTEASAPHPFEVIDGGLKGDGGVIGEAHQRDGDGNNGGDAA